MSSSQTYDDFHKSYVVGQTKFVTAALISMAFSIFEMDSNTTILGTKFDNLPEYPIEIAAFCIAMMLALNYWLRFFSVQRKFAKLDSEISKIKSRSQDAVKSISSSFETYERDINRALRMPLDTDALDARATKIGRRVSSVRNMEDGDEKYGQWRVVERERDNFRDLINREIDNIADVTKRQSQIISELERQHTATKEVISILKNVDISLEAKKVFNKWEKTRIVLMDGVLPTLLTVGVLLGFFIFRDYSFHLPLDEIASGQLERIK